MTNAVEQFVLEDLDPSEVPHIVRTFVQLTSIPSPPRQEQLVAEWCRGFLEGLGLSVVEDNAAETVARGGAGCGNLLVKIPPNAPGTPIFLGAHLDTVALNDEVIPVFERRDEGLIVVNQREAILGGDNKSAVAVLLELARELATGEIPHAGVELLFTPCEEIGLLGAMEFDVSQLDAEHGFVFDHAEEIGNIVDSAPTQMTFIAAFKGRASHSGIAPELGRSAIRAASEAISNMPHGRIDEQTTSNVGLMRGGSAVNIVPENARVVGEVRSIDQKRCAEVFEEVVAAFANSATKHDVDLDLQRRTDYHGYRFTERSKPMQHAMRALQACDFEPKLIPCGGGSDANVFNAAGKPCVNIANGMRLIHTSEEYMRVADLESMLRVTHALLESALDQ